VNKSCFDALDICLSYAIIILFIGYVVEIFDICLILFMKIVGQHTDPCNVTHAARQRSSRGGVTVLWLPDLWLALRMHIRQRSTASASAGLPNVAAIGDPSDRRTI
jgi:hypothetical protein